MTVTRYPSSAVARHYTWANPHRLDKNGDRVACESLK
jgi:Excalibur calcium-binding domain